MFSIHFIDGKPTVAHPYQTQNLGLNVAPKPSKLRQEPAQHNIDALKRENQNTYWAPLINQLLTVLNLIAHKAQIMHYWGGCGKISKLRKTGPLKI